MHKLTGYRVAHIWKWPEIVIFVFAQQKTVFLTTITCRYHLPAFCAWLVFWHMSNFYFQRYFLVNKKRFSYFCFKFFCDWKLPRLSVQVNKLTFRGFLINSLQIYVKPAVTWNNFSMKSNNCLYWVSKLDLLLFKRPVLFLGILEAVFSRLFTFTVVNCSEGIYIWNREITVTITKIFEARNRWIAYIYIYI